MNIKKLIIAAAVFAATGSVFAQQTEFVAPDAGFQSAKSRAEVKAELNQAKASGAYVTAGSEEYAGQFAALRGNRAQDTQVAGRTRAEVVQELRQARASGNYVTGGEEYVGQHVASTARHTQAAGE